MASGTLGQSAPVAATNTTVYTVPSGKLATVNLNLVNRGSSNIAVRLAVAASSTPANQEYLEYDAVIPANGVLERTGLVISANKQVVVYTNTATLSVNVYGFEE
jgi:hypothetical protein